MKEQENLNVEDSIMRDIILDNFSIYNDTENVYG